MIITDKKWILQWTKRYLEVAKLVATWSKDPSTQVGAVIVGEHGQILTQGYNGFPRGVRDSVERLENREEKYSMMVHAEMNCIYNASLSGVSLNGASLYVYGLPICSDCAKGVIQAGIKCVYMAIPGKHCDLSDTWLNSFKLTKRMFDEAGVLAKIYEEFA